MSRIVATPDDSAFTDVEKERRRIEEYVRSYWENNGKIYVNQKTFYSCMSKIGIWLNIPSLIPHLQDQGLATNTDDTDSIINPFFEPHMRRNNLLKLAERGGEYGHFLLYMCIREALARGENPHGHGSAIAALETNARSQNLRPPWENSSSNSHPENSPSPRLGPDGSHSSPSPQAGVNRLSPLSASAQPSPVPLPPPLITAPPESNGEAPMPSMTDTINNVGEKASIQELLEMMPKAPRTQFT